MFDFKKYRLEKLCWNCLLKIILLGCIFQPVVRAQQTAANASPPATAAPAASPTPIPYSDIIAQSDAANATLKEIASSTSANQTADTIERDLPALTDDINIRLEETAQAVENRQSLEKLRSFESDWRTAAKNLPQWKDDLTVRARKLETNLAQIDELAKKWAKTQSELANTEVPPEASTRIQDILAQAAAARRQIEAQQARIVSLQDKVAEQQKRVDNALASIRQTRQALVGQLLVQDHPPIWSAELWAESAADVQREMSVSLAAQTTTLYDFVSRNIFRIVIHLLIFMMLAGSLIFLRKQADPWVKKDHDLKKAAVIFYLPVATALVLAILFTSWIYPQTPQIVSAIIGATALVPTIIILRKLVERSLDPILYSLVIFYLLDQLRTITDSQEIISRLLFLAEMLGGFVFFLWLNRRRLKKSLTDKIRQNGVFRTFKLIALLALPIFAFSFLANVFGYVALSQLLGNAVLRSTYIALILYGIVRIADGLIIFALRFRPLCLLRMVQNYRALIQKRVRKFLRWAAFAAWVLVTLELLSLREPLFERIKTILNATPNVGWLNVSLGDILLFAVTVWAAFLLSRFVRFALEEDVYPRVAFDRGLPYAISTLLNYTILLVGFFLAVATAGFDLTKFTILAGAFGVGIGFGLQNIINNFVSGLILLFERPVKVGDIVKIGDASGTVQRIGIRASIVHVWDNSDIIVPNSKLISDNVTNWTFSTQQRGIEIIFSTPPATAARTIIEIMEKVAEKHPLVTDKPLPQVLFDEISFDRQTFKLRVWTDYFDKVSKIRSDLVLGVSEELTAANIPHEKINSADEGMG